MLYCYSETLTLFVRRLRKLLKTIIEDEVKLTTRRESFVKNGYIYPLRLVTFEHPTKLGYFQSDLYEIGIHKELMEFDDKTLREILRHEFAHYLTFLEFGDVKSHGSEFRSVCKRYGWHEEVKATLSPQSLHVKGKEKTVQKIKKLLDLASSHNVHEANSAMEKAKALMIKHGVKYIDEDDKRVVKRVLYEKRATQKMRSISEILRLFFVYPVLNHGKKGVYLELFGSETHVEIAEYVAHFLDLTFEILWKNERSKGIRAKNSFIAGLADGFIQKQKKVPLSISEAIVIQNDIEKSLPLAYPRLSQVAASGRRDQEAFTRGKKEGSKLSIRSPITRNKGIKLLS